MRKSPLIFLGIVLSTNFVFNLSAAQAQSISVEGLGYNFRIDNSIRADNKMNVPALTTEGDGIDTTVVGSIDKVTDGLELPAEVENITTGAIATEEQLNNYCYNVSDSAVEARNAILKKRLTELEKQVDVKLIELQEKTKELQDWMAKRESFSSKVNDSVVQIFQAMRPDAAASQFAELGPVVSAAIVAKLSPKTSSLILTEMDASEAAEISMVLTSALKGSE